MTRKIIVNNNEYLFVNEYRNTRSGFAHDCKLYVNLYNYYNVTCRYQNRTWECYRF